MSRRKKKGDEINTNAWMDTYADTITLLLTFFILLYSISAVDSQKLKELSEALQFSLRGSESVKEIESLDEIKVDVNEENNKYEDLSKKLNQIIQENSLAEVVKIREEDRGIVLQLDESILFDPGNANIKESSIHILDTISKIIEDTDNEIVAEGHTDNIPINNEKYKSNWELSTARSVNIVKYLIENKNINPARISVKGYGEYNPIAPNDTPENRTQNRRVDILVVEQKIKK